MGEVAAELFTDFPERFRERRHLYLLDTSGSRRELRLENFWPHKERFILKFHGIDSISDAESLIGAEIQIPKAERAKLEPGAAYVSDLIGCHVFVRVARAALSRGSADSSLSDLGVVSDVTFGAGTAPILQIQKGKKEYLVPFAQEYIKLLDTTAKRIELELPEGMLELDAPLTEDEKRWQQPEE